MTVTVDTIRALPSGEFKNTPDDQIASALEEARLLCNDGFWGTLYDLALKYLTAHLLSVMLDGAGGPAGPIVEKRLGSAGARYASPKVSESAYQTTVYGRHYAMLLRSIRYRASPRML